MHWLVLTREAADCTVPLVYLYSVNSIIPSSPNFPKVYTCEWYLKSTDWVLLCIWSLTEWWFYFSNFFPENKMQQKSEINLQNKKKKSSHKKITGFQVIWWVILVLFSSHIFPTSMDWNMLLLPLRPCPLGWSMHTKKEKLKHCYDSQLFFQFLIISNLQFAPGSSSEVLITSADSRIRVVDGVDLVQRFKGMV